MFFSHLKRFRSRFVSFRIHSHQSLREDNRKRRTKMINPVVGSFGVGQSVKQLCFKARGLGVISILPDKLQLAPRSCN